MSYSFQTGLTYSFTVYPSYILGTDFKNVVVLGVVNYEIASKYADIYALHAQVYPTLPEDTPNNPESYDYLLIKTTTGNKTVVGLPWIKEETIAVVDSKTIQVLISQVSANDITAIRNALVQNGFMNLKIDLMS